MAVLLLGVMLLATTLAAYAAGEPSASSNTTLQSGCARLVLNKAESSIPSFAGSSSTLTYGCNIRGLLPAIWTTTARSAQPSAFTPTFTLPTGWSLSIGRWQLLHECTPQDKTMLLISGHSIVLPPGNLFVYCLTSRGASTFSSFTVTWSH